MKRIFLKLKEIFTKSSMIDFDKFVGKLSELELSQKVSEFVSDEDKLNGITKINLRGMPLVNRGFFVSVCSLLSQSKAQSVNLSRVTGRSYSYNNRHSSGTSYWSAPYFRGRVIELASSLPDSCTELSLCDFNSRENDRTSYLLDFIPNLQGKNIKILDISSNNNGHERLGVNYWANIFKILPNSVRELKLNGNYIGECIKEYKNSESDEYKESDDAQLDLSSIDVQDNSGQRLESDEYKVYFVTKLHLSSIDVQNNSVEEIQAFLEHFFPNLQELKFSDDCFNEHSADNAAEKIKQLKAIYAEKSKEIGGAYNAFSEAVKPEVLQDIIGGYLGDADIHFMKEQAQQDTPSASSLTK